VILSLVSLAMLPAAPAEAALPRLSISGVQALEGNAGATPFAFTVTMSRKSDRRVTVKFATQDLDAAAPSDYSALNDTLRFRPGTRRKTITVFVNGDTVRELSEQFQVTLSNARGARIANGVGVGQIENDDFAAVGDVIISEVMADPLGADSAGEYIELHNPTGVSQSVQGWSIWNGPHDTGCSLGGSIPAGGYFVVSPAVALADSVCPSLPLANAGDTLSLREGGFETAALIDAMTFPAATEGSSYSLDPESLNSVANDTATNWCLDDGGTAGSANIQCP
jgi:hypothetical protein